MKNISFVVPLSQHFSNERIVLSFYLLLLHCQCCLETGIPNEQLSLSMQWLFWHIHRNSRAIPDVNKIASGGECAPVDVWQFADKANQDWLTREAHTERSLSSWICVLEPHILQLSLLLTISWQQLLSKCKYVMHRCSTVGRQSEKRGANFAVLVLVCILIRTFAWLYQSNSPFWSCLTLCFSFRNRTSVTCFWVCIFLPILFFLIELFF